MKLALDPLVELMIGVLIVHPDMRPDWVRTYDDARRYAELWAARARAGEKGVPDVHLQDDADARA